MIFLIKKTSEKILYNYGKSKIIICNNTIANISDLDDFFTNVKKIIKKMVILYLKLCRYIKF